MHGNSFLGKLLGLAPSNEAGCTRFRLHYEFVALVWSACEEDLNSWKCTSPYVARVTIFWNWATWTIPVPFSLLPLSSLSLGGLAVTIFCFQFLGKLGWIYPWNSRRLTPEIASCDGWNECVRVDTWIVISWNTRRLLFLLGIPETWVVMVWNLRVHGAGHSSGCDKVK